MQAGDKQLLNLVDSSAYDNGKEKYSTVEYL